MEECFGSLVTLQMDGKKESKSLTLTRYVYLMRLLSAFCYTCYIQAPTIWTVLDGWALNSPVGAQNERQRFIKTHMTEPDNLLEILLRLVRGERATPFSPSVPAISAPTVSGPLLSALSQGSAHGAQQTHVSLAVLAMSRMCVDYAQKAFGDKGKAEAEEKLGEIIRCLPSHLIYKSLDGIFKEWRVEKKGGR